MPALTVSSSIVGTTMGRTFSAVPYTYLKRGVYYFVIAAFGAITLSGCQTTAPMLQ